MKLTMLGWTTEQAFNAIKEGTVTLEEFNWWVSDREVEANQNGFQSGIDQATLSFGWDY
jgi:hypothetical protein